MIIFLGDDGLYREMIKESVGDRDIVVSCQYRHKVPKSLIDKYTCVNIHYGLLPKYAGCNPIYWQIKDGICGVTLHYMDENFDSGDIIDTFSAPCGNLTADELYNALRIKGFELFKKHYNGIVDGTAPQRKQNLKLREYKSAKDIDFDKAKHVGILDDKNIRALHFDGKQYPIVKIGERNYELRNCDNSL